jgi:hypothetical protein
VGSAAALLGAVGTILLLWLTVFDFSAGLYLSQIAVAVIACRGYTAARDETAGARRNRV